MRQSELVTIIQNARLLASNTRQIGAGVQMGAYRHPNAVTIFYFVKKGKESIVVRGNGQDLLRVVQTEDNKANTIAVDGKTYAIKAVIADDPFLERLSYALPLPVSSTVVSHNFAPSSYDRFNGGI
jgi:hypothetical protein